MLLALDTSLDATSAAVGRPDGTVLASRIEWGAARQAELLMPMVARVLEEAGVTPAALTKIAVTVGPGSFTGLRIALAAARAMGVALHIPVVGIATTRLLRAAAPQGVAVLVALDARHGRLYVELFDEGGNSPFGPLAAQDGAALGALIGAGVARGWRPPLILGSGTTLARELLLAEGVALPPQAGAPGAHLSPDARGLLPLAAALAGAVGDMPRPLYLRAPDARTLAERGL